MKIVEQDVNLSITIKSSSIFSQVEQKLFFLEDIEHSFFECGIPIPANAILKNFIIYHNETVVDEIELRENFSDTLNAEQKFYTAIIFQDNTFVKLAFWNITKGDCIKISFEISRKQLFNENEHSIVVFSEVGVVLTKNQHCFSQPEELNYIPGTCYIDYKHDSNLEVKCLNNDLFINNNRGILNLLENNFYPPSFTLCGTCDIKHEHFGYYNQGSSLLNLSFSSQIDQRSYYFTTKKVLTVIIECTPKVMGIDFEKIKEAAIIALSYLKKDDLFAISAVGKSVKKFKYYFCDASEKNLNDAIQFIDELESFESSADNPYSDRSHVLNDYLHIGCFVNFEGDILIFRNNYPIFFENKLIATTMKNFSALRYYAFVEISRANCSTKERSAFCSGGYCEYIYPESDIVDLTHQQMKRVVRNRLNVESVMLNGIGLADNEWMVINSHCHTKRNILINMVKLKDNQKYFEFKRGESLILQVIYDIGNSKKIKESYKILPFMDNSVTPSELDSESKFFKHLNLLFLLKRCKIDFGGHISDDIMKIVASCKLPRSIVACNTTLLNNKDYFLFSEANSKLSNNNIIKNEYSEKVDDIYNYEDDYNEEGYFKLLEEPEIYSLDDNH